MTNIVPRRKCDYRDCKEYRDKFNLNQNVKFFSFPSDQERRRKWLELSKPKSENPRFICSKHFENKYISHSQRRVHLVTSAIPIDYNKLDSLIDNTSDINKLQFDEIIKEIIPEVLLTNTMCLDDTLQLKVKENDDEKSISNSQQPAKVLLNSLAPISFRERKLEVTPVYSNDCKKLVNPKKIKLVKLDGKVKRLYKMNLHEKLDFREKKESKNAILEEGKMNVNNTDEDESNRKTEKVKTILIHNEEYIQMPKSLYIKERMDLLNQIENYKSILKEFKEKLEYLDLS